MNRDNENIPASSMIAVSAFRYALGRRTYIVSSICDWLIKYKDRIHPIDREIIVNEIDMSIKDNTAGSGHEERNWRRVATELGNYKRNNNV